MNPSKPETNITFNTTESMAEWAWRYGEAGVQHEVFLSDLLVFPDGSIMQSCHLHSAIAWRCLWDKLVEGLR